MGHLFISYSRKDKKEVRRLVTKLEKAGHNVWLDTQDIEGGDQWRAAIVGAIKSGHALIVAISPHSVASKNVRKELDVAEHASVRIIPVRLGQAAIPDEMEYQLAGVQEIDLAADPKAGMGRLLRVLGDDKAVVRDVRKKWKARLFFGALFGTVVAVMFASTMTDPNLVLVSFGGAVLGAASGFLIKLLGWIILWFGGAVAGGVAGAAVAGAWPTVGDTEGAAVGVLLGLFVVWLFRRWRRSRKRSKLEALAAKAQQ